MAPKQHESSELVMMPRPMDPSKENWAKITDQGMGIAATGIAMRRDGTYGALSHDQSSNCRG